LFEVAFGQTYVLLPNLTYCRPSSLQINVSNDNGNADNSFF